MVAVIRDTYLERDLIAKRRESGADKYDEVWNGVYVMSPMANNEHQQLAAEFAAVLSIVISWSRRGRVAAGVNISDRMQDWQSNYRCPDVAVFLNDTKARDCDTFWYGGPDLAIEIVSEGDQTLEKLPFYAHVGTRELLVVDRDPWKLTLYRLQNQRLAVVGESTTSDSTALQSEVVPLTFAIAPRDDYRAERPAIFVAHLDGQQRWTI